jgi:hypothetical protein
MKDIELEKIIESMKAAGCSDTDTDRVRNMHKAGMDGEIIHCLRKCRCALMEELRDSQKRVDRMDRLIRMTESS